MDHVFGITRYEIERATSIYLERNRFNLFCSINCEPIHYKSYKGFAIRHDMERAMSQIRSYADYYNRNKKWILHYINRMVPSEDLTIRTFSFLPKLRSLAIVAIVSTPLLLPNRYYPLLEKCYFDGNVEKLPSFIQINKHVNKWYACGNVKDHSANEIFMSVAKMIITKESLSKEEKTPYNIKMISNEFYYDKDYYVNLIKPSKTIPLRPEYIEELKSCL
jgi:hypothetical protein